MNFIRLFLFILMVLPPVLFGVDGVCVSIPIALGWLSWNRAP